MNHGGCNPQTQALVQPGQTRVVRAAPGDSVLATIFGSRFELTASGTALTDGHTIVFHKKARGRLVPTAGFLLSR